MKAKTHGVGVYRWTVPLTLIAASLLLTFTLYPWALNQMSPRHVQTRNKCNDLEKLGMVIKVLGQMENTEISREKMEIRGAIKLLTSMRTKHTPGTNVEGVCSEVYENGRFVLNPKCAEQSADTISRLVTIVLNFQSYPSSQFKYITKTLHGIRSMLPNIRVLMVLPARLNLLNELNHQSVIYADKDENPGKLWNILIDKVTTPYVLIGRDLVDFNQDVRLERLVREMFPLKLNIIGGATKTASNGHWSHGCYQTAYRSYILVYKLGYRHSTHDCVFCHSIQGPFMARTEFMQKNKFNEGIPESVMFHDYFLDLLQLKQQTGVCPDSMFNIRDEATQVMSRERWLPLAKKRSLTKIVTPNSETLTFTRKESGIPVDTLRNYTNPPCLVQYFVHHIKFVLRMCHEHNIYCAFKTGLTLCSAKFNGFSLWERDGDLAYLASNRTALKSLRREFSKAGYRLKAARHSRVNLESHGPHGKVDLDAEDKLDEAEGRIPTKVLFHGEWIAVPRNLGKYIRDEYKPEIYRHIQYYSHLPLNNRSKGVWIGRFMSCPTPGQHNCLDQYKADGNLHLGDPTP